MRICVVLVTYDRREELARTLSAYEAQEYPPQTVLVVDNHSTDGTAEMLAAWREGEQKITHRVLTLPENRGGSGGFYAGMEAALATGAEWIFLSDDDALPRPDALRVLYDFTVAHPDLASGAAALCGAVDTGAGFATGHRARIRRPSFSGIIDAPVPVREYQKEYFIVDFFSYIGVCVRASALREAGFCRPDFFLYGDDFEHALRVGKEGKIYCVPACVLTHKDNNPYARRASWRDYYATRNLLLTYRAHFGRFAAARRGLLRRLSALRSFDKVKIRVISDAIRDARRSVTGEHPVYRPGWEPRR